MRMKIFYEYHFDFKFALVFSNLIVSPDILNDERKCTK